MNITPISISNIAQKTGISFAKKIESSTQDNKASGENLSLIHISEPTRP